MSKVNASKTCRQCSVTLTGENAYQNKRRGSLQSSCKACGSAYAKAWREQNREKERARARAYYRSNRDHLREVFDRSRVLRKYGLTPEQIAQMKADQGGLCAVCLTREASAVDHNHATGAIRAILCRHCNTTLGLMNESPETLRRAANYLEKHSAQANRGKP